MVRFLHAADIHLDSPMRKLERYEGAPAEQIRHSTRRALTNLFDLAIDQTVDFVLIAGDLYDGDWRDHNTGLFFAREATRLQAADIPLYFISGNHDAASKLTKALPLPKNPDGSKMQLSSSEVDSVVLENLGVAIHGRGFQRQAETDNLAIEYPAARRGVINIGMLHTSLQGGEGHAPYAPCTPQQLADKGYDYWALGHIHTRGNRCVDNSCPIVFSGNTQGRNIRECGPKGCILVELDQQRTPKLTFCPLDVCRWQVAEIDASEMDHADDIVTQFSERLHQIIDTSQEHTWIVRARIRGATALHHELIARQEYWMNVLRQATFEVQSEDVWLEQVKIQTTVPQDRVTIEASGPVGELMETIREAPEDEESIELIDQSLRSLIDKLPSEIVDGDAEGQGWNELSMLRSIIEQAEPLLVERLLTVEVDE